MPYSFNLPVANYNVSLPVKYWLDQLRDVITIILVVSICINYNISSKADCCQKSCHKSPCKTLIYLESDNVICTALLGDLGCPVTASVIYDKDFDGFNTCNLAGNSLDCYRQCSFFIKTGDLYDKLHPKITFQIPPYPP